MTLFAKYERCIYCGQMHPAYLEGCPNLKRADGQFVRDSYDILIEVFEINVSCPYCSTESIKVVREDDGENITTLCKECKKWFIIENPSKRKVV